MAEKHTTLGQMEKLARRGRADTLVRVGELLELVIKGLKAAQHISITVTLPADGWSDGVQTVKDPSLLADGSYCYFAYGEIGIDADDIAVDGQVTFQCEETPDRDLTVTIIRLGLDTEDDSDIGKVFNLCSNESLKTYIDVRFGDFYDALINERPIYFGLCDSDSKALLDSSDNGIAGRVIFQIKGETV